MSYMFRTPIIELKPARGGRLLSRYRFPQALTVLKRAGVYEVVQSPSQDVLDSADIVYMGGRDHIVSDSEASDLSSAGYGEYLTLL